MSYDSQSSLRRRAAVAVLSNVLDETALLDALWLQHESMRGESVSDVIAFVDAIGAKHQLDAATRKRLYSGFFSTLKAPEAGLPDDPWPKMQAQQLARMAEIRAAEPPPPPPAPPAPVYVPQPVPRPVPMAIPQPVPVGHMAPPVVVPPPPPLPVAPPVTAMPQEPQIIYGAVMRAAIMEIYQYHREAADTVWTGSLTELERSDISDAVKMQFSRSWMRPMNDDWVVQGMTLELAELIRIFFVSLSKAFGRVGADQILGRGVAAAEKMPEARKFSPKRLLSSL
ncbi:MAG: hypothetical protein AB3X41_01010 [Leptothrix ochracea]|uniref:hypothetical protein n=1 Tax=Leptothrix ochracea TaxID=735331 RepID=UPI0034E2486F